MNNNCIEISRNELKKSLPDVAYNLAENNFFVFWAAAPGEESQTADYFISGQRISSSGEVLGKPVEVIKPTIKISLPVESKKIEEISIEKPISVTPKPKPKPAVQEDLPVITTEKIMEALSNDWQPITSLIFRMKVKI